MLALIFGIGGTNLQAQYISGQLSDEASVSILTVGPADPAYTMFGHTAIRLQDPVQNIDRVYNYGTFDFESPNFYLKFLHGDLSYYLSVGSLEAFKQANLALGRSIVSQTLELSPQEVGKLVERLEYNALPENRSYQYRFFSRNCVTEVRDLLTEQDIWELSQTGATVLSSNTYREQLETYLSHRPWIQLGINLMLGSPADQPVTDWEKNFLPNSLHYTLANSFDEAGQPVVRSAETIARARGFRQGRNLPPIFVLWTIFLVITAYTATSLIRDWQGQWLDQLLFGAVGILGLIIAYGSFISMHQPLHNNWNLLWALPTHLLAAVALPWLRRKWIKVYFLSTLVLGITVVAGWEFLQQEMPAAAIPVIATLMIRSMYQYYLASRSETISPNTIKATQK